MATTMRSLAILCASVMNVAAASSLWSTEPVDSNDFIRTAYLLGNGRLGAMPAGVPRKDYVTLNVDSLWSGGPFENRTYNGGNPPSEVYEYLPGIRDWIFESGTGNVTQLLGGEYSYGSYMVAANLTVDIEGAQNASTTYRRELDLVTAVHTTNYELNGTEITTTVFCSYPDSVCVYNVNSSTALPAITIGLENTLLSSSLWNVTCEEGAVKLQGLTADPGMQFYAAVRALSGANTSCSTNRLVVAAGATEVTALVALGTNYDQAKGNAANEYSFLGPDPGPVVDETVARAAGKTIGELMNSHVEDYQTYADTFRLTLPTSSSCSQTETSELISAYNTSVGNPCVESLLFNYGRYLFISSSRDNSLPPNLQGRWSSDLTAAWSADYHIDVNEQMFHWGAVQTGLGPLQTALFNFMANTWVPYGEVAAELLYNATGGAWVSHDEMNIFGYTGMKEDAIWADYPAGVMWQMLQVQDWFDYSGDESWYQSQGYPLLKGVAKFWLSQLQEDKYFNDGTLVVNPCNSPEHGPTTFGCTHYQQLIWQLFDRILATWSATGDSDDSFRQEVSNAFATLDPGVHVGSWGQLQEWKLDIDVQNDTHRHLSGLVGWYPGYSVSGPYGGNETVRDAVETLLWSRGPGDGSDADAGWEKVWRAACWAGLNNTERAFFELSFAIDENFAGNGLSMYTALDTPFQIDANFGVVGAITSMLIRDLPQTNGDNSTHFVVLGPAIPASWAGGSVQGMRVRGGGSLDFSWDDDGLVNKVTVHNRSSPLRTLNAKGDEVGE